MIKRVGGKSKSRDFLISKFPKHKTYVEAFVGGGSIFFRKPKADVNVVNDLDKDIYHTFKDMRDVGENMKNRDFSPSRTKFKRLLNQKTFDNKSDRLYRNLYLSLNSFGGNRRSYVGGKEEGRQRGVNVGKKYKTNKWKDALKDVRIENKDYSKLLTKYDDPSTFFFLDPPYEQKHKKKNYEVDNMDFEELANNLKRLKGKFLLTINDSPRMRQVFKNFRIRKYTVTYEISGERQEGNKELYITNY